MDQPEKYYLIDYHHHKIHFAFNVLTPNTSDEFDVFINTPLVRIKNGLIIFRDNHICFRYIYQK